MDIARAGGENPAAEMKAELHRLVDQLPEADAVAMIDDLAPRLWLMKRIHQAQSEADAGGGYTTDQAREILLSRRAVADAPQ